MLLSNRKTNVNGPSIHFQDFFRLNSSKVLLSRGWRFTDWRRRKTLIYLAEFLSSETAYLRMPYKTRCGLCPCPRPRHFTRFKVNCVSSSYGQMLGAGAKKMDKYGSVSHSRPSLSCERGLSHQTFPFTASMWPLSLGCVPRCAVRDQWGEWPGPGLLIHHHHEFHLPQTLKTNI